MVNIKIVFFSAFNTTAKSTVGFVMSVRVSVLMERLGFHCKDVHEIFRKSVEKIQVLLKSAIIARILH